MYSKSPHFTDSPTFAALFNLFYPAGWWFGGAVKFGDLRQCKYQKVQNGCQKSTHFVI